MLALMGFALILVTGSTAIAEFLKLRFEDAAGAWMSATVVWLFIWYCAGSLHLGFLVWLALTAAAGVFTVRRWQGDEARDVLERLISPQMSTLGLALIMALVLTRGRSASLWDELRLWAALPKLMFFSSTLQVGPDALLLPAMQTYIPGMPLWQYFVEAFNGSFIESRLFFAYAAMGIVLLLPVTHRLTWRTARLWLAPSIVLILLIPAFFFNARIDLGDYYASLYVDPMLGVVAGATAAQIAFSNPRSYRSAIHLGLMLGLLITMKDTALIFAIPLSAAATLKVLRSPGRRQWRAARVCLLNIPPAIVFITWRIIQSRDRVANQFAVDYGKIPLKREMVTTYWKQLSQQPLADGPWAGWFPMAPVFPTALLLTMLAIGLYLGRAHKFEFVETAAALAVAGLAFHVGLFFLVFVYFGGEFASFARYSITPLTSALTFLTLYGSRVGDSRDLPKSATIVASRAIVGGVAIALIMQFSWRLPESYASPWRPAANQEAQALLAWVDKGLSQTATASAKVALVFPKTVAEPVGYHHQMYFDLIGTPAQVWSWPKVITVDVADGAPEEGKLVAAARDTFQAEVVSKVDYVYVVAVDDSLVRQFSTVFVGGVQSDRLYRVAEGQLILVR